MKLGREFKVGGDGPRSVRQSSRKARAEVTVRRRTGAARTAFQTSISIKASQSPERHEPASPHWHDLPVDDVLSLLASEPTGLSASAATGGRMSLVGFPPGDFPLNVFDLVPDRKTTRGSIVGIRTNLAESVSFAAGAKVPSPYSIDRLGNINERLERMAQGRRQDI